MSFFKDSLGISTLLHDTNNRFSIIRAAIDNIHSAMEEEQITSGRISRSLKALNAQKDLLMQDIDEYYKKLYQKYEQERQRGSDRG